MATSEIIFKAIRLINPTAEMTITENDLDTLVWLNGTTPCTWLNGTCLNCRWHAPMGAMADSLVCGRWCS